MAQSNHERVGKALEVVKAGLPAFVERELKNAHGTRWLATAKQVLGPVSAGGVCGGSVAGVSSEFLAGNPQNGFRRIR